MRNWGHVVGLALLSLAIVRCGGNDICLNCDAVPTPTPGVRQVIRIEGSINSAQGIPMDDVRVIACFDLDPNLKAPADFNDCLGRTVVTPDSDRNFAIENDLSAVGDQDEASIRIGIWVPQQDVPPVFIMDGDFFAELNGVASAVANLEDVRKGQTAQIFPIDVLSFATVPDDSGMAETDDVRVFTTPETTPTPTPEPTP